MGFVRLARVLWRRRVTVLVGALLAIAVAIVGIHRGGGTAATTSSLSQVLIDTPKSLITDARAPGATTIYPRAQLVAALVADEDAKVAIARRAGLRPSELAISGPGAAAPPRVITPLSEQAIEVAKPIQPYLVTVEVDPAQPIVSINAHASDRAAAVRLGRAAVQTLPAVAAAAPGGGSSVAIEPMGPPLVVTTPARGHTTKAVAAALALFLFWCIGCVVLDRALTGASRRRKWHDLEGALE
jgi:hypothetical protein